MGVISIYVGHCTTYDAKALMNLGGFHKKAGNSSSIAQPNYFVSFHFSYFRMEFVLGTFIGVSFCGNEMHTRCSFIACFLAPNSVIDICEPVVPRRYFNAFMLEDKYSQIPRDIFNFLPCSGTLVLLWKMTIRFFITVRPHGTTPVPMDGFS